MFGVGVAACTLQIPMVHLCGGSVTTGAIDDVYRHSLTKMSQFHFVTCEVYRRRVIQLGESPENVYNVGSLAIENCYNAEKLSEGNAKEYRYAKGENIVLLHIIQLQWKGDMKRMR